MTRLTSGHALLLAGALAACSTGKPPGSSEFENTSGRTGGSGQSGNAGTANAGSTAATGGSAATGDTGGTSGGGGDAASSATGGALPMAGSGTGAGTGGASAAGGAGGTGGLGSGGSAAAGSSGAAAGGTAGMDPGVCQALSVISTPQVPTVELLVDTSSSMWEDDKPWDQLYQALMDDAAGAVKPLQSKIRFGFASYKGHLGTSEADPACATMTVVEPALDNYDAIKAKYDEVGASYMPNMSVKWETPTGYAITYAAKLLTDYMPDPPGKKYILLVTDGNPNTCAITDPQCGQDIAIKATQDAFAAGIGLFVIGFGTIVTDPKYGCPTRARCGTEHLQDLANAGIGAAVHPAPTCDDWMASSCEYKNESCNGGILRAAYTVDAPDVGKPFAIDSGTGNATAELTDALNTLLADAVSCTVDMDAVVTGDPALGKVALSGSELAFGDPNGWKLEDNKYSVTLVGTACTTFKAGGEVSINFPCDPSGNPVAVHR